MWGRDGWLVHMMAIKQGKVRGREKAQIPQESPRFRWGAQAVLPSCDEAKEHSLINLLRQTNGRWGQRSPKTSRQQPSAAGEMTGLCEYSMSDSKLTHTVKLAILATLKYLCTSYRVKSRQRLQWQLFMWQCTTPVTVYVGINDASFHNYL